MKHKRMSRRQLEQLAEYNRDMRKLGCPPVMTLRATKFDRENALTTNKIPSYTWSPRVDRSRDIPSHVSELPATDATARRSIMEQALRGNESPEVTAEIIRKSKCMAPAYNKGAVQYIGSVDDARYAGKKT
jgi:hypothetical protein